MGDIETDYLALRFAFRAEHCFVRSMIRAVSKMSVDRESLAGCLPGQREQMHDVHVLTSSEVAGEAGFDCEYSTSLINLMVALQIFDLRYQSPGMRSVLSA